MRRLAKLIAKTCSQIDTRLHNTLSLRLSLMVALAIAVLLMSALFYMLYFSRKAVKEEALQKAVQTLEGMVHHIDNVLLGVEQSAGNIYWTVLGHLNQPDQMSNYCLRLMESNANVSNCAIAFEPYYYKERGQYFMTYVHRTSTGELETSNSPIIQAATFGNHPYTEQSWYTMTMQRGVPFWTDPIKDADSKGGAITSFCLPIYDASSRIIGVLGVDVSLSVLSKIILAAKPSPNSYCVLLGSDGSYLVHPDSNKLLRQTVYTTASLSGDPGVQQATLAMMSGMTGYKRFHLYDRDSYVFYKPFQRTAVPGRSMSDLRWSTGIVYPVDDILVDYNVLLYYVLAIAAIGLLLLTVLCWTFIHYQLYPLRILTQSAQRIADGNYNDPIPDSRQQDEVGQLQDHFQQMQQSLATHMGELEQLNDDLRHRGDELRVALAQSKKGDRMKTAFLHNMTNQMVAPVSAIGQSVSTLCNHCRDMAQADANRLVDDIKEQGDTIANLLNNLLKSSEEFDV